MINTAPKFAPVFEKDGNRLVLTSQYWGETKEKAREIGIGAMPVECITLRMRFKGEVIATEGQDATKATIQGRRVYVLSGPLVDADAQ